MKKIYVFLFAVLFPTYLLGAISGSGTAASPYYGTLSTSSIWNASDYTNGTVYVGKTKTAFNFTILDGGSLTINSGVTVIFVETVTSLIITGTGRLTINGSSSSNVTLKSAKTNWGHVFFNSSSGGSSISYCTIKNGNSGSDLYGGGIFIYSSSSVLIDNSNINNCSASYGGGIEIWDSSPIIENCIIVDNSGAGIEVDDDNGTTSPSITNCTIVNNVNLNDPEYGGIQNNLGTPTIKNCLFWNNTGLAGSDYSGGGSISYSATTQGVTGTGMITLSSVNTGATGPNFANPSTNDYNLTYISPCRDAGTPTGAPTTDILGKGRVGIPDMGAYEFQYSRWNGSANDNLWATASNWDAGADPSTGSGDVYIPTGLTSYPTASSSQDFTILSGKNMTLEPGAHATLNALTNNGTLKLNASSTLLASLILNSYTRGAGGVEQVQLYLTGGGTVTTYAWHYISTPFTSFDITPISSFTNDLAQWIEPRPVFSLGQGWVAFDGYDYYTGTPSSPTFSTFDPGKGYDYYKSAANTFTFSGLFNTGDISVPLSYTAGDDNFHGLNLLGNPFSSGLDWDYITTHSFPANTSNAVYFTRNNVLCTYSGGVGVPSDVTGIIPPMQGFFTKTYSAGNTIVMAAAARTHTSIHATYKKSLGAKNAEVQSKAVIPLVRLSLTDGTQTDETVVRFDAQAKSYLDNDFDALKLMLNTDLTSIYSSLSGVNYAINGLPFPATFVEIPVTVNLTTDAASKTITATQLQGLDNYTVTLTDISTGFVTNLKTSPTITFSAAKGSFAGRFILKITAITTGIENPTVTVNKFNIYPANNRLNIQTLSDDWDGKSGSVRVLDMSGKVKSDLLNVEFQKNSLVQTEAPTAQGVYVVEIRSGVMRFVGKVVIR